MGGLNAPWISNTMMRSTRLQIPTLSRLGLKPRFPRWRVPRRAFPHSHTGHPLVSPATQPLAGHIQNSSNTLPEPRVPVVPTGPVVSTSVLQHPCRPTHIRARTLPLVRLLPALPPRTGWVNRRTSPRYAASYNYFERWNLGFANMGLESEAELLSALPPPIRRYQAQS